MTGTPPLLTDEAGGVPNLTVLEPSVATYFPLSASPVNDATPAELAVADVTLEPVAFPNASRAYTVTVAPAPHPELVKSAIDYDVPIAARRLATFVFHGTP